MNHESGKLQIMEINFNKKFYSQRAIKKAIRAYQKLARFKIKEEKKYFRVILDKIDPEIKNIIKDEFSNYVLSEVEW